VTAGRSSGGNFQVLIWSGYRVAKATIGKRPALA
jgi:hypothetical protein